MTHDGMPNEARLSGTIAAAEFLWEPAAASSALALTTLLAEDGFFRDAAAAPRRNAPSVAAGAQEAAFPGQGQGVHRAVHVRRRQPGRHVRPQARADQVQRQADSRPSTATRCSRCATRACCWARRASSPSTASAGIEVSRPVSRTWPQRVDDMAVIRSMYTDSFAHGSGLLQMNTGFVRQGYPSLGSWVTYGLGTVNQNLPGYVVLLDHRGGPISGPPNWGSGFMPATYQGTQFRTSGDPILNLPPPDGHLGRPAAQPARPAGQAEPAATARPRPTTPSWRPASPATSWPSGCRRSAPEAVDLSSETAETQQALRARRPDDRAVRPALPAWRGGWSSAASASCRSIPAAATTTRTGTPTATSTRTTSCTAARPTSRSRPCSTDLKRRGLLDETLVVWTSEFGRTPTGQNGKGRDHSPRGFTAWLAGGGVKGGQAIGATDDFGYAAVKTGPRPRFARHHLAPAGLRP